MAALVLVVGCAGDRKPEPFIESPPLETTWVDPGYDQWPAPWSGVVHLHAGTWDYGHLVPTPDFAAHVSVGTPAEGGITLVRVAVHDLLTGLDDCGLTEDLEGEQNVAPETPHEWLDAGEVVLHMPDDALWSLFQFPWWEYAADLSSYGIAAVHGGAYTIAAEGEVFPEFEVSIVLPDELIVTAPEHGALLDGPVPLEWTGSSDSVLEVKMRAFPADEAPQGTFTLTCSLVDDGEYTIPAELIERLPSPVDTPRISWNLRRVTVEEVTLPGGEVMGLVAEAAATIAP